MGRYYGGDIEGKFWFAVQPSNDISNLVACDELEQFIWKCCGCVLEKKELFQLQKKCIDECKNDCIHLYCSDCYESAEIHRKMVAEDYGEDECDELYEYDNQIMYELYAEEHLNDLNDSLQDIAEKLPTELIEKYKTLENDENIIHASHFNVIDNEYLSKLFPEEKDKNEKYSLIARYQLGLQIKYKLVTDGSCSVYCEL